ncbi:hypothetical protein [Xanthomonas campestris]|uniref:hypothetical protein n=1 Tax=Xanthomonas campestris TaxID=339 RepID=UPI001EDD4785|nr:hypothetical protein [Xanthomonas campestris]
MSGALTSLVIHYLRNGGQRQQGNEYDGRRQAAQLRSKHHEASLLSENTGSMPMPCATYCIVRTPQHASLRRMLLHAIARLHDRQCLAH